MVQLHLFVVESQGESQRPEEVPTQTDSHYTQQRQAQTHTVIPDQGLRLTANSCCNISVMIAQVQSIHTSKDTENGQSQ